MKDCCSSSLLVSLSSSLLTLSPSPSPSYRRLIIVVNPIFRIKTADGRCRQRRRRRRRAWRAEAAAVDVDVASHRVRSVGQL